MGNGYAHLCFSPLYSICSSSSLLLLSLRSSSIRPGQFGYGRVPFSLPLHRTNRQVRHTLNGTDAATSAPALPDVAGGAEADRQEEEQDRITEEAVRTEAGTTEAPATELPTTTSAVPVATSGSPQRRVPRPQLRSEYGRPRVSSSRTFSRSSSPSLQPNHQRFDWHSVTAPPPPSPSLPRLNSPASSHFSTSLHRPGPVHIDRDPHPGFSPQVPPVGSVYPLQHPHTPHLGAESGRDGGRGTPQSYRCPGLEKEYRKCFSQVTSSGLITNFFLTEHCRSDTQVILSDASECAVSFTSARARRGDGGGGSSWYV